MAPSNKKIRAAYVKWIRGRLSAEHRYLFANFTLKQGIKRQDGTWEPLTPETANNEFHFLQQRINYRVYRKAFRRFGKSLTWVDCAEGGQRDGKRAHRHIIIEIPARLGDQEFIDMLKGLWRGSRWSHAELCVEVARNVDAVVTYITKTGADAVCVGNLKI